MTDVSTWAFPILPERCSSSAFPRRTVEQPTQRQQQPKAKKQQQQQQQQAGDRGNRRAAANKRSAPGPPFTHPGVEGRDAPKTSNKRARTAGADEPGGKRPSAVREPAGNKRGRNSQEEEGAEAAAGGGGGVEGLTAFVVNLPFSTTHAGLKDMFKGCGGGKIIRFVAAPLFLRYPGLGVCAPLLCVATRG